jgi:hypothetical protein
MFGFLIPKGFFVSKFISNAFDLAHKSFDSQKVQPKVNKLRLLDAFLHFIPSLRKAESTGICERSSLAKCSSKSSLWSAYQQSLIVK